MTKKANKIIGSTFAKLLIKKIAINLIKDLFFFKFLNVKKKFLFSFFCVFSVGTKKQINKIPMNPERTATYTKYSANSPLLNSNIIGNPKEKNRPSKMKNSRDALSFVLKK